MYKVQDVCTKNAFIPVGMITVGALMGRATTAMSIASTIPLIAYEKWRDNSSLSCVKTLIERNILVAVAAVGYKAFWQIFSPFSTYHVSCIRTAALLIPGSILCVVRSFVEKREMLKQEEKEKTLQLSQTMPVTLEEETQALEQPQTPLHQFINETIKGQTAQQFHAILEDLFITYEARLKSYSWKNLSNAVFHVKQTKNCNTCLNLALKVFKKARPVQTEEGWDGVVLSMDLPKDMNGAVGFFTFHKIQNEVLYFEKRSAITDPEEHEIIAILYPLASGLSLHNTEKIPNWDIRITQQYAQACVKALEGLHRQGYAHGNYGNYSGGHVIAKKYVETDAITATLVNFDNLKKVFTEGEDFSTYTEREIKEKCSLIFKDLHELRKHCEFFFLDRMVSLLTDEDRGQFEELWDTIYHEKIKHFRPNLFQNMSENIRFLEEKIQERKCSSDLGLTLQMNDFVLYIQCIANSKRLFCEYITQKRSLLDHSFMQCVAHTKIENSLVVQG